MNQNIVGIGAYARPVNGCGCGSPPLGSNPGSEGPLNEAVWVLGIGAVVMGVVAYFVVSKAVKDAGF